MSNTTKLGVSGILFLDGKFLLAQRSLTDPSLPGLWNTPGGGVEFGEHIDLALEREFVEEVQLKVMVKPPFISIKERITDRHCVMIFKEVELLDIGVFPPNNEIIKREFFTLEQIIVSRSQITDMTFAAITDFAVYKHL